MCAQSAAQGVKGMSLRLPTNVWGPSKPASRLSKEPCLFEQRLALLQASAPRAPQALSRLQQAWPRRVGRLYTQAQVCELPKTLLFAENMAKDRLACRGEQGLSMPRV